VLAGRIAERARLDRLLAAAQTGRSAALVVRGEPGIGKTALLAYTAERARGCRVLRAAGVESEMELPFAALEQLCAPLLGGLERLPPPQRDAIGTAFGLGSGARPDRFLVGLALLSLLSDAGEAQPLICLIDDAQWLDRSSAQVLAFVARRLQEESVVLLFAEREPTALNELAGLPDLRLERLSDADARTLLASVFTGPLDERVRERIIAETRGNPLALLELSPAELAGGFGVSGGLPGRIEASFLRRVGQLPAETRLLLLAAAAEPIGDPALLSRAATELGIPAEAAVPAQADDLLQIGVRVTFRHPLLRSAIYSSASPQERRKVHGALAAATDSEVDPDRRAWHRAQAASGPDEAVAVELERAANRAQDRGGLAAAAAFLEGSTALTPDPAPRAERALAAARVTAQAGAWDPALRLLAMAEAGPLAEFQRAQADLLRGQIAFTSSRGSDAPPLLLKAARRLEALDIVLARETYLEALFAALHAGRFATGGGLREAAEAARAAPPGSQPPGVDDLFMDGLALLITEGHAAAAPTLKRALSAFSSEHISTEEAVRGLWLAGHANLILWDDESWDLRSAHHVELARDSGALGVLPMALSIRAGLQLHAGDFAAAASLIDEAGAITEAMGGEAPPYGLLTLAAFRGRERQASELIEISTRDLVRRGEGVGLTFVLWATAVLYNGLARYEDALTPARNASEDPHDQVFSNWAAVELIEAATRSGVPEHVTGALERLSDSTRASGSEWALGIEARTRALVSEGQAAEDLYREAIARLGRSRIKVHLARAHLVYGEWLRHENRRLDAREHLRTAHQMFVTMGAEAFAERAARELRATGENARKRTAATRGQLTPQETQIARLAAAGNSNREIGAQLFVSPRTVEYHLGKVFAKLAISSRGELRHVLPGHSDPLQAVADRQRGE
jgi:DNA-binding CsgD family transcriptional regulator